MSHALLQGFYVRKGLCRLSYSICYLTQQIWLYKRRVFREEQELAGQRGQRSF